MPAIVFGKERKHYFRKDGSEVDQTILHYFETGKYQRSLEALGYFPFNAPLVNDVDFPEIPGSYNLIKRPRREYGKNVTTIQEATFVNSVVIPDNGYLIIGLKAVNYRTEGMNKSKIGTLLFALDTIPVFDDSYQGFSLIQQTVDRLTFRNFPEIPAYYDLTFEDQRGKNGQSISRIVSVEFLESFKKEQSISDPSVSA